MHWDKALFDLMMRACRETEPSAGGHLLLSGERWSKELYKNTALVLLRV